MHTKENEVKAVTAQDVIQKRQLALVSEVFELDAEIAATKEKLAALELKHEERMLEYDMWESYDQRNIIKVTHTSTTTVEVSGGYKVALDRVGFEDSLKRIMQDAGKPLAFGDIRNRLEKFGWVWSNYYSAHQYITNYDLLESAGKRGFYQLVKR